MKNPTVPTHTKKDLDSLEFFDCDVTNYRKINKKLTEMIKNKEQSVEYELTLLKF